MDGMTIEDEQVRDMVAERRERMARPDHYWFALGINMTNERVSWMCKKCDLRVSVVRVGSLEVSLKAHRVVASEPTAEELARGQFATCCVVKASTAVLPGTSREGSG